MFDRFLSDFPNWTQERVLNGTVMQWALLAGLIIGALFLRRGIMRLVRSRANIVLSKTTGPSQQAAVTRSAGPVGSLIAVLVIRGFLPLIGLEASITEIIDNVFEVLLALAVMQMIFRAIDVGAGIFQRRAEHTASKLDDQLVPIFRNMCKILAGGFAIIFILQNFNVNVTALLAGASLGGLALSLAAKDTAANIFSSLSIFTDKPFQIGDYVVLGDYEGTVIEVGMRSTRLRSSGRSIVTVPNATVATVTIDNLGLREWRRVLTTLGLSYSTTREQITEFVTRIRQALSQNPLVVDSNFEVHFNDFGESSLNIMLQFFIRTQEYSVELKTRQEVFLECMKIAEELGIEFAFPTRTIHIASQPRPTKNAEPQIELQK